MSPKRLFLCPLLLVGILGGAVQSSSLWAQENAKDLDTLSLEQVLDMKINVASSKGLTMRESPGIVSVITREEILNSGARDLIDVLLQVPGFFFGSDVLNVVGLGIRGNWAHEGKVLLQVDGIAYNETLYNNLEFGNHFPLEQIKRIEIIRGPGSAMYGGYAELGVINIITQSPGDINGVVISGAYGQMSKTFAGRTMNVSFGKAFKDFGVSAQLFFGEGNRSDRTYTDVYGTSFNMQDGSALNPVNLNLGFNYKGLSSRFILDHYHASTRDAYDVVTPVAVDNNFYSSFFDLKYEKKLKAKWTLTPLFSYKRQLPWECVTANCVEQGLYFKTFAERLTENVSLAYDPTEKINITTGGELYQDRAWLGEGMADDQVFPNGQRNIQYTNVAFFAQGLIKNRWADLTLGARFDDHSLYGSSFVPRVGLTKVKDKFHFKLLVSKAFRAPGIENIRVNPEIKPEHSLVSEFEAGYQFTKKMFITANVFDIRINQPIVYSYDVASATDTYANFDRTGTRGFEVEYRIKDEWGYTTFSYSHYQAHDNRVDYYAVTGNPNSLLGFPSHKFAAQSSVKLYKGLSLNPSLVYFSHRYGYTQASDDPLAPPTQFDPRVLANLNFAWRDFVKNWDADLGIYDIFGQNMVFIQPYKGSHAPLPGPSREFRVRIAYRWSFKK